MSVIVLPTSGAKEAEASLPGLLAPGVALFYLGEGDEEAGALLHLDAQAVVADPKTHHTPI